MTLLHSLANLLLHLIGQIFISINNSVILLITTATIVLNSLVQVGDELGRDAAPLQMSILFHPIEGIFYLLEGIS